MELIKITEEKGKKVVSARDLHGFLKSKKQFADWIKHRISKYGLIEYQDYVTISLNGETGGKSKEYALTLEAAKELAMVEGNAKGKEARQYFIECERKAQSAPATVPQTQAEMILSIAQLAVEQERKVSQLDNRVTQLEAKAATRPEYMTIMGYAILCKIQVSLKTAAIIGRKASKICKDRGHTIDKIKDPRFGLVGSYPESVLEEVFKQTF